MNKGLPCLLVVFFLFLLQSTSAQSVFLKGNYVEVGIHPAASFGSSSNPPSGYHPNPSGTKLGFVCDWQKDGWTSGTPAIMGDYFVPGTPEEGWGVEWNNGSTSRNFNNFGLRGVQQVSTTSLTNTSSGSEQSAYWVGIATNGNEKLQIEKRMKLGVNNMYWTMEVLMKNVGSTTLSSVEYFRSVDPDNEQAYTGKYETRNFVRRQPGTSGSGDTAVVIAKGIQKGAPCILGTIDSRAKVSVEGFSNRDPDDILDSPRAPSEASPSQADEAIALAFRFGDLAPGQCVTFTYFYGLEEVNVAQVVFPLQANFVNNNDGCSYDVMFLDSSTGIGSVGINSWEWDMNNDGTYDVINDTGFWTYPGPGTYYVKLRVTNCLGETDSITKAAVVISDLHANFNVNPATQCFGGHSFSFTNTSTNVPGSFNGFYWNFGDTTYSSDSVPGPKSYSTPRTVNVRLVATNNFNCKDSVEKSITIWPQPQTSFTVNDSVQCQKGHSFVFTNSTTIASGSNTYFWNFGDGGSTSTSTSPTRGYANSDTFRVKVVATSNKGCKDSTSHQVRVLFSPTVQFTVASPNQCLRENKYDFINQASAWPVTFTNFLWKFGDGTFSTDSAPPTKVYANAQTYTPWLIVTNSLGCKDSIQKSYTVWPSPIAAFSINDSDQCKNGNSFNFTNNSTLASGSMTYNWYYGDGGTSTATSPNKSYNSADTFRVKLIPTTSFGCKDSIEKKVYVFHSPVAAYSINNSTQCLNGNQFDFADTSTIGSGTLSYQWKFGDATQSSSKNDSKTYVAYGTYAVNHIVTSNLGCKDSVSKNVTVYAKPSPAFTVNDTDQCVNINQFQFTNNTNIGTGTLTYNWDFGNSTTSTSANPNMAYAAYGTYIVKLVATSNNNCKDSISKQMLVFPKPTPAFTINDTDQCLNINQFQFTNSSTIAYGTNTYTWKFGDGNTSLLTSPAYAYAAQNTYNVKLVALSNNQCTDSIIHQVVVFPNPIPAFAINDTDQCVNVNQFVFTNTSAVAYGSINYTWTFGDGNTSVLSSPNNVYAAHGTYPVKLLAVTDHACRDSITKAMLVFPKPNPAFAVNDSAQCLNGNQFVFTNSTNIAYGVNIYTWNFDDGNGSILVNPSHSYLAEGNYKVQLLALSNNLCTDSITRQVAVHPRPQPSFIVNDSGQCVNDNKYEFLSTSVVNSGSMTYRWDFGNGDTANTINPSSHYTVHGSYVVRLRVSTNKNCVDSVKRTMIVHPKPDPLFTINDTDQCVNINVFNFTNQSSIPTGTQTYKWWFGDGNTAATTHASNTYANNGAYSVKLLATSDFACKDSVNKTVTVYPKPDSKFSINDSTQCLNGNKYIFNNTSVIKYGTLSYVWDYGNNDGSPLTSPIYVYAKDGSYNVKLLVISDNDCRDSLTRPVIVYARPNPDFSVNDSIQCYSEHTFTWIDKSTINSGFYFQEWDMGNSQKFNAAQVNYRYKQLGVYPVKLKLTSDKGCVDSITKIAIVNGSPVSAFTANDSTQCLNVNHFALYSKTTILSGTVSRYEWYYGDTKYDDDDDTVEHVYAAEGDYTVKLRTTSDKGCRDSAFGKVTVYPTPDVDFSINIACQNDSSVFTNLTQAKNSVITGWEWDAGDGSKFKDSSPVYYYKNAGLYDVMLTAFTKDGCSETDTILDAAIVKPSPIARFSFAEVPTDEFGTDIQFTDNSAGPQLWEWYFGDTAIDYTQNPLHRYKDTGWFHLRLKVTNSSQCDSILDSAIYIRPIFIMHIPTAFTPDGGSLNEQFGAEGILYYKRFKMSIYNRWGERLFEADDHLHKWDGTYKGVRCPPDTYIYMFEILDAEKKIHLDKGSVMLIR